jgi:hypothetical protein
MKKRFMYLSLTQTLKSQTDELLDKTTKEFNDKIDAIKKAKN